MNSIRRSIRAILAIAICILVFPTILIAETANFDDLNEGIIGTELTNGGITFFDLDNGQPGLENVFIIEHAEGSISDPNYSPSNGMTATSYTPGAEAGYGPVKEMTMTTGGDADAASVEAFTTATLLYGNTVTMEAIKDGTVVDSVSVVIQDLTEDHFTLTLSGIVFDTLKIISSPNAQVLLFDNITIDTIDICECDIAQNGICDGDDWQLFGQDWGRSDCLGSQDVCECDLNQDGICDGDDWQLFGQDWGRSDCP